MKSITYRLTAVILCMAILLSGCKNNQRTDTIVIGMESDLKTLDPGRANEVYSNLITHGVYEGLLGANRDNCEPELRLAEQYEVDENGIIYTFWLREGLNFASGNPITSEDVRFSLERRKNLEAGGYEFLTNVKELIVVDERTIQLVLKEPDPYFLNRMVTNAFSILDSKVLKEKGGSCSKDAAQMDKAEEFLSSSSAGSGPYVLKSWVPGKELILERNESYWGVQPKAKQIIFKETPSRIQKEMLEDGEIDIAFNLTPEMGKALKENRGTSVVNYPSLYTIFLMMNADPDIGGPMADDNVRKAVRYAIDYDKILEIAGDGAALPLANAPRGVTGALERKDNYRNLKIAADLMKRAGYEDGFHISLKTADYTSEGLSWLLLAEEVKKNLAEIGITVDITVSNISDVIDSYRGGGEAFLIMHWYPDYPELFNQLVFLPGQLIGKRANWNDMDTEYEKVIEGISRNTDPNIHVNLASIMQQKLNDNSPYAFLVQPPKVIGVRPNIKGLYFNDIFILELASLEQY